MAEVYFMSRLESYLTEPNNVKPGFRRKHTREGLPGCVVIKQEHTVETACWDQRRGDLRCSSRVSLWCNTSHHRHMRFSFVSITFEAEENKTIRGRKTMAAACMSHHVTQTHMHTHTVPWVGLRKEHSLITAAVQRRRGNALQFLWL